MPKAISTLILDTNVILDCYFPDRSTASQSISAVDAAIAHGATLLYTAAQAKDIFFLSGHILKSLEKAENGKLSDDSAKAINCICWDMLENLDSFAAVIRADGADAWLARKYRAVHSDFEDNLVVAAAVRANADFVVTNDEQLLKHAPVATITPAGLIRLLDAFDGVEDRPAR